MGHFWSHTHSRRNSRGSGQADGGASPERTHTPGVEPAGPLSSGGDGWVPSHQEIAELAYSYWEARGCQGGSASEDWLRAERELKDRGWP